MAYYHSENIIADKPPFLSTFAFTKEIWEEKQPVMADHIRVQRFGGLYAHHGIYVSDKEVIHFTGQDDDSILDWEKCEVIQSDLDTFLKGGTLEVKVYTDKEFEDLYSPEQIVDYARSCIGDKGYNLAFNNCEHFANACTLGKFRSHQVERVLNGRLPNEEENMGFFGKIGGVINSLFGGSKSSGGSRSTSSTVYEPDKVKVAQIEAYTKIRLATMEAERIEAMKQARLDILEYETQCNIALEQAKVQGFTAMAETILALQEKLNVVAQQRLEIIEKGSLPIIREIESFYEEMGDRIQKNNEEYNLKKLPALLEILRQYDPNSIEYDIYRQQINDDRKLQQQYYIKQIDAVANRQSQVIAGFISSKEKIVEQTGHITKGFLETMQNQTLQLSSSHSETSPAQLPYTENKPLALPDSNT